ncbi:MAG: fused MFS/spermidine synthase [Candidatus Eisenbacteria bacterium]|nr:fused MFS/spermidine synthase [Candidatus Eisenbacteria bacterium]
MILLFSITLFLGALLLFLIQPIIAKMVLPYLGGSPSVWNTCMVFFQAALLAGYAYAHALPSRLGVRRHAGLHLAVLALPLWLLPVRLSSRLVPDVLHPVPWLLALLTLTVGAPVFAIASAAPLLQRWFVESGHRSSRDPYFLYVASNAGSLAALIGYPFVIEPHLRLGTQNFLWATGYAVLLLLTIACALTLRRPRGGASDAPGTSAATSGSGATGGAAGRIAAAVPRARRLRWLALSAIPSSLMLGVTTYITTDIAPVPLFWLVPLTLYLVTFIVAFARPPSWVRRAALAALPAFVVALIVAHSVRTLLPIGALLALHLAAFFFAALACHCELATTRPAGRDLTTFYLWLSLGGVLGGALNALLAPVVLPSVIEYPFVIALASLALASREATAPSRGAPSTRRASPSGAAASARAAAAPARPAPVRRGWAAFGLVATLIFFVQSYDGDPRLVALTTRNFFGVHRVKLDPAHHLIGLQHGTTVHGIQSTDPARRDEPLSYYHRTGPAGELFAAWSPAHALGPVAIVGLGIGSLADYAQPGQSITFYELDPEVVRLARDTTYFTCLADAGSRGAKPGVVLGDARLQLARSHDRYGLLILDAFNSDAVPVHLLTREALATYLDRLDLDGVLAIHISSQHFRLEPVVAALAQGARLVCLENVDAAPDPAERAAGKAPSRWVVMARAREDLAGLDARPEWHALDAPPNAREWTDDYSNLAGMILWGGGRAR